MSTDKARQAAVEAALEMVEPDTTIGLGSGRAVFALAEAIGKRWPGGAPIRVAAASTKTVAHARAAQLEIVDLADVNHLDVAFDGADEADPQLQLIKGGGAAMLREKLVIGAARRTVIMIEEPKLVDRLGEKVRLPVEIIPFAWPTTLWRLETLTTDCKLRTTEGDQPVTTDEGNYIIDVVIPNQAPLRTFANDIKLLTGVVEHGLFLDQANLVIVGYPDGSIKQLERSR